MQGSQTENTKREDTFLERINSNLIDANRRFDETLGRLNSMGHKLSNTNTPDDRDKKDVQPTRPEGLLSDIQYHVNEYYGRINQLEALTKKLSELI